MSANQSNFQLPLITVHNFLQHYKAHSATSGDGATLLSAIHHSNNSEHESSCIQEDTTPGRKLNFRQYSPSNSQSRIYVHKAQDQQEMDKKIGQKDGQKQMMKKLKRDPNHSKEFPLEKQENNLNTERRSQKEKKCPRNFNHSRHSIQILKKEKLQLFKQSPQLIDQADTILIQSLDDELPEFTKKQEVQSDHEANSHHEERNSKSEVIPSSMEENESKNQAILNTQIHISDPMKELTSKRISPPMKKKKPIKETFTNSESDNLNVDQNFELNSSERTRIKRRTKRKSIFQAWRRSTIKKRLNARRFDIYTSLAHNAFKESILDSSDHEEDEQIPCSDLESNLIDDLPLQTTPSEASMIPDHPIDSQQSSRQNKQESSPNTTDTLNSVGQKHGKAKAFFEKHFQNLRQIKSINPTKLIPTTYSYMPYVALCTGSHSQEQLNQFVIQFASQLNIEMIAILNMRDVKKLWGSSGALVPIVKKFNGQKGVLILDNIHLAKANVIFMLLKLWTRGIIRRHVNANNFKARKRKISFREKSDKEFDVLIDVRNIIFILNTNVLSSSEVVRLLDSSMDIFTSQVSDERMVEKVVKHYYNVDRLEDSDPDLDIAKFENIDLVIQDVRSKVNDRLVEKFKMQHVGVTSFDRVNIIIPFLPGTPSLISEHVFDYITRKLYYYNQLFLYYKDTSISWDRRVEKWIFDQAFQLYNKKSKDVMPEDVSGWIGHSKIEPEDENLRLLQKMKKLSHFVILYQVLIDDLSYDNLRHMIGNSPQARWKRFLDYLGRVNQHSSLGDSKPLAHLIAGRSIRIHIRLFIDDTDSLQRELNQFIQEGAVRKTFTTAARIIPYFRRKRSKNFVQRLRSKL